MEENTYHIGYDLDFGSIVYYSDINQTIIFQLVKERRKRNLGEFKVTENNGNSDGNNFAF